MFFFSPLDLIQHAGLIIYISPSSSSSSSDNNNNITSSLYSSVVLPPSSLCMGEIVFEKNSTTIADIPFYIADQLQIELLLFSQIIIILFIYYIQKLIVLI
jgi:hypothetical protein